MPAEDLSDVTTTATAAGVPAFSGHDAPSRALIDACVHCGFCLPTCPTYVLWGEEMDSPRGRIYLMKGALEGRLGWSPELVGHFDACLGCVACVTACPSGVQYGPLIERARAQVESHYPRSSGDRVFRGLLFRVLPYPGTLRVLLAPLVIGGRLLRSFASAVGRVLPRQFGALLALAPAVSWSDLTTRVAAHTPARGERRLTVGLLTGCVQSVVFP